MDNFGKNKIFLIDGYPRNQENIDKWNKVFGKNYILVASIVLTCNEEDLEKRLLERAKTSRRVDDNIDVIRKRFKTHIEQSQPIEAKLKKMGLFIEVQGNGTVEEVFSRIKEKLYIG